ncbi:MAG: AbrB/MazE/SpoVT family DNA-binding domain-containing protein [Nitrososphaeria archaeon]|nr:AbrB/MazE/SpoVT family DNA-binding domain-containing protein [Nitrososphaeria archaeon]
MRNRELFALSWLGILLLAVATTPIQAGGYSVVENDVEVRMDYPVEMVTGNCYTITFWMKASQNLTDLRAVLTIYYHVDSAANILYDKTIVSEGSVATGWTTSKTIRICIPDARPRDPYVRSKLQIYYKVDGVQRGLSHEWYMAIVRSQSYENLESQINELRAKINNLCNEIKKLERQLADKEQELEELQGSYGALLSSYSSLTEKYQQTKAEFESLSKDYEDLEKSYQSLRDKHQATIVELEKLRSRYEMLMKNYDNIEERYQSLLGDYQTALSELSTYKTMYLELKSRYENLQSRHEDLIVEAAGLRQKIADLEQEYGELNRVYQATLGESSLTRNVLFAQTAAVIVGIGLYALLSRKFMKPPAKRSESAAEGNGEKKIQRILSGRRITIPSEVAAKLGLKEGDQIEVDYGNGVILVRPVKEAGERSLEKMGTQTEEKSTSGEREGS